jgi:hypothetical protein
MPVAVEEIVNDYVTMSSIVDVPQPVMSPRDVFVEDQNTFLGDKKRLWSN